MWSAPLFMALLFGRLLLAGWIPPPSPSLWADQVAAMYTDHTDLKRLACILIFLGGGLTAPFTVAIDHRLRLIPGARALALLQLIGGALGVLAVSAPAIVFMAAAFRPERDPDRRSTSSPSSHSSATWSRSSSRPPRSGWRCWPRTPSGRSCRGGSGSTNLWTAFLTLPGLLLIFFRTGAFAWNGVLVFWVVATVFGGWYLVMFTVLRARLREEVP